MEKTTTTKKRTAASKASPPSKTREGSGYLKQLYSNARTTAGVTHSHLRSMTTILVNFIPTDKIDPSELQVRTHFEPSEIEALAQSIKKHGVLQPILVVQNGDRYKVIAGERRLRATKLAGLDRIPARVITSDDESVHEVALRENLDRVDLHPIEEGEGYVTLLEAQVYASHDAIAQAFGKKKSRVTEYIGYTRLPDETKEALITQGVKNRAVLRQLMQSPADMHAEIIRRAVKNPDELETGVQIRKPKEGSPSRIRAEKSFEAKVDASGIQIPALRWKAGEGAQTLRKQLEVLKEAIRNIEKLHLKASSKSR